MDKLFSAGKQFLEEQVQNQSQSQNQNQHQNQNQNYQDQDQGQNQGQFLPGGNKAHGGNYPAGGGFQQDDDDLRVAHEEASSRAGSSGNSDLFSSILGAISQNKGQIANQNIDEEDAINQHKKTYNDNSDNQDAKSLGTAAAMQAFKLFNQGETGQKQNQGTFMGLAMSEASKLFDNKAAEGKVQDGASKQTAIQQAGEMAMKLWFQSQAQQSGGGGLMGLASKFLK